MNKETSKRIGVTLSNLYKRCWDNSIKVYSKEFHLKEMCDRAFIISMTNSSFLTMCNGMGKKIKELT